MAGKLVQGKSGRSENRISSTRWNPGQYLIFGGHRLRPAIELIERIPLESPAIIYDLGCGTGNVTRILTERFRSARVYGLDHSSEMLKKAAAEPSVITWIEEDIEDWVPEGTPDLIFANASLHWITHHEIIFPKLVGYLSSGGCLAVQMPLSWDFHSHRLMRETLVNGGPGGKPLGSAELMQIVNRKWVGEAQEYYDLLASCVRSLDIWETEYLQVLEGEDPVFEWVKATGLRPILGSLQDDQLLEFIEEYKKRLHIAYKISVAGHTLYPFRRLFIVGVV